ncbi:Phage antirepressor protein [Weissella sp. DD23]|uniref:ORF6C domain-containing protein n=1 Tax=Weissella sp. DD23 TaxID=1777865 RepID=UPI0007844A27|nr:ORF6C domain-containing protein [Weissella sp. DD23]KXU03053.1 Phage antirepressor protein [Weissella sp. DD23]
MANEVQIFNGLKIKEENGQVMFDAESAAIGMGITQEKNGIIYVQWKRVNNYINNVSAHVRKDENSTDVSKVEKGDFITEPQFYKLAIKANNETAEHFQDWVTEEVLPSIRKTGGYQVQTMTEMEIVAASANKLVQQEKQIAQIEERQTSTESDLAELKNQMGLPSSMRRRFTKARNKRVAEVMGGYYGAAYQAKTVRSAVYKQLERVVKNRYDIESYGDLPIAKFDEAMRIVQNWQPDEVLMFAINGANEQTLLEA